MTSTAEPPTLGNERKHRYVSSRSASTSGRPDLAAPSLANRAAAADAFLEPHPHRGVFDAMRAAVAAGQDRDPDPQAVVRALDVMVQLASLPLPHVAIERDGSVELDWATRDRTVYVVVSSVPSPSPFEFSASSGGHTRESGLEHTSEVVALVKRWIA